MDASPSLDRMIGVLKQEFRAHGLRHRDIADRLGISEITLKRYLGGKGVSVPMLDRMAGLVGLNLMLLANVALQQFGNKSELTEAQEQALADDRTLHGIFILLVRGWQPARILDISGISPETLEAVLAKSEALGLIRRPSPGRLEVLVKPQMDWRNRTKMLELAQQSARQFLQDIDLSDAESAWFYNSVPLSRASEKHLEELIDHFRGELRALTRRDSFLPADDIRWYGVMVAAAPRKRPLNPEDFGAVAAGEAAEQP